MRCNLIKGAWGVKGSFFSAAKQGAASQKPKTSNEDVRVQIGHGEESLAGFKVSAKHVTCQEGEVAMAVTSVRGRSNMSSEDKAGLLRLGTMAVDWQTRVVHIFNKEEWKMFGLIMIRGHELWLLTKRRRMRIQTAVVTLHCRRPSLCSLASEGECSCQVSSKCNNSSTLVYSICFILSVFCQLFVLQTCM